MGLSRDAGDGLGAIRFSDVIGELQRIAALAQKVDEAGGSEIASACHRVESLITRLRNQFIDDLISDEALETSAG